MIYMDKQFNLKPAFILSILVAMLASVVSVGGLLLNNLYRDNDFVKSAWFTNDIITLLVAVPLLIAALWFTQKGSVRCQLVWMGMLGYMAYNFAFYLFGAAFNILFIVYVALFSLSVASLILKLSNLDLHSISLLFSAKTPVKGLIIYLLVIAVMLFAVEMGMISNYLLTGILPETIKLTGQQTSVVFAMDLSIVVPLLFITAILLWKRLAWGYVLGIMMLLKGFTYGLVLSIGTALLAHSPAYGKWDPLMPFCMVLTIGGFTGCWVLLKKRKEKIVIK